MYKLLSIIGWYSFKNGVCNLIRWFPVIWRDREFDRDFLYRILHKKLEHMEKFFRNNAYAECAITTANQIQEGKEIIKKLLEDAYFDNWLECIEKAEEKRKEDKKRLFQLMYDNIDDWWD